MFSNWKQKLGNSSQNDSQNIGQNEINGVNGEPVLQTNQGRIYNRYHIIHRNSGVNNEEKQKQLQAIMQKEMKTRTPLPTPHPVVEKKAMKWGEPTWTLFHTLAHKIDESQFSRLSKEFIDLIKTICHTLPCPDCAMHASQYVSKVNWSAVRTKRDLIVILWEFHNEVNKRKGFSQFPLERLEETYGGKNVVEVIRIFMVHYEDKNSKGPNSAIASKFHRQRVASRLKVWFNENIRYLGLEILS